MGDAVCQLFSTWPSCLLALLGVFGAELPTAEAECAAASLNMTELCKEAGEIWSRLFDHRPFLSGEIKFMLKEFEEKRSDREVETLFSVLEDVTDIKDTQLVRINRLAKEKLPELNDKLDKALELCSLIEDKSTANQLINNGRLLKNRTARKVEWDQFIEDMTFKCKRIDNAFEEKEEELRDFYADLDHKLNITK